MGAMALLLLVACGGGDAGRIVLRVQFNGLPDLGDRGGSYEGWLRVDGELFSTGKFVVDDSTMPARITSIGGDREYGTVADAAFGPSNTRLGTAFPFVQGATEFFVTIEPESDADGEPSDVVVFGGAFNGSEASLTAAGLPGTVGAGVGDLSAATGSVLLANPTGGGEARNGVWFVRDLSGIPSLNLPPAPGSWAYEAWVTRGNETYSLGRFTRSDRPDSDAATTATRGPAGLGFAAPGQDFVQAATTPATEVLDLANGDWSTAITLEPEPDTSADPFPLVLLDAEIPVEAVSAKFGFADAEIAMLAADPIPAYLAASSGSGWFITGAGLPQVEMGGPAHLVLWSRVGLVSRALARVVVDGATGAVTSPDGVTTYGTTEFLNFTPANTGLGAAFPDPLTQEELFFTVESAQADMSPGVEPSPSAIVAGAVAMGQGVLSVMGSASRGVGDLRGPAGRFTLQSPTDDRTNTEINDAAGIYFRRFFFVVSTSGGISVQDPSGLELPPLRAGWRYEGWVIERSTGRRISTGRFRRPRGADEDAATWPGAGDSRLVVGFDVPGQDFVTAVAAASIPGPLALDQGWTAFVTLESTPDNSAEPSVFEILRGPVPTSVGTMGPAMTNTFANFPSGRAFYEP